MLKDKKLLSVIFILLLAGFVLRLVLSFFGTLSLDQGTFIAWGNSLANNGFKVFYNSWSDYFPGYLYVLWLLAKINTFNLVPESTLFKLPAILADLITGWVIYKILKKSKGEKYGLIGASIYIFNPAVLYNSSLWGQVDSFTALTSILSIYLLPVNFPLSAMFLSIGTLIKPQTAFIFPIIIFLYIKDKRKIKEFLLYCLIGLAIFILAFVPFWNHGSLLAFIYERLGISLGQYPYTSVNAFNFWGIVGTWQPDNIYYQVIAYALVLSTTIFLCFKLRKAQNPSYYLLSFVFAASFTFFTRMHERHLLPVFAPLAIVAIENPLLLIPYIGFSGTYVANMLYSYYWITDNFKSIFSDYSIKFMEMLNVAFVVSILYTIIFKIKNEWKKFTFKFSKTSINSKKIAEFKFRKVLLSNNKARLILYTILFFAFITRVFGLNSPPTEYFDEVYHAFTAKVIMSNDVAKAWEWWNTPPEGFAYEWTHPPLAKLGMVVGMSVFGKNSFGYRIPGAILGVLSVFIIYLLAKELFKDEIIGLLSAAVFSLDGLALVMSRIGMNDSYILFFMLLSIYLYLKDREFFSALMFGLAISSKWSAIYAIPIFGIIFLSQKKELKWNYLWFFVLPPLIYLASYFDMFLTGHSLKTMWEMQQQMWWYHTGLRATHPYSSPWWSWPMLIRPIYLYTSDELGGTVSRIYAFGNPLVFWFGLVSIFTSLYISFVEKNKKLGLIVFSYVIFFVPWALSPRIMFIYHYLPSVPFLAISTGYILRRYPKIIPYFFVISLLAFIYFYPHWAGIRIPLWLDQSYYWFSSWR